MKIDLNKDFEEQYKNELWKGFTARELEYGAAALLVAAVIALTVWKTTGLAINLSIYTWNSVHGSNHLSCNGKASGTDLD